MKNILQIRQLIFVGLLMIIPFTLAASNYEKQSNLKLAFQSQTKELESDSSEYAFKMTVDHDSSTNEIPKVQFSNPFPNPASSFVRINYHFPSVNDNGELKIMDLTGKMVMSYPLDGSNNTLLINVSSLTRGLYFCTIYYHGQIVKSNKLIVSNQ